MLPEQKKQYFRRLLQEKLDEVQTQIQSPTNELAEKVDESTDFVDQASMESELNFTLHIKERGSKLIAKIHEALDRLEDGTFGICEVCGEEISEERLKARPVTTLCIECKKKQEAEERLRGV